MKPLENRTVVITGALGGLGRAVCASAEAQGARVIGLDITHDESLANCYAVDLTNADATRELIQSFGPFDSLVNLAGGFAMGTESWDSSDEQWDLMFSLNVSTMRNAIKAAVPMLLQQQAGSIVNVGAFGAREGQGLMGAYCASKTVVMRLTETLAEELKTKGINVNAVLPTVIDTDANRSAMPENNPAAWVSPDDLAAVICFLLSPAAKAVHGALLPVRGLS
ncbi:MAG: SDR family NAD(P)-dependent oxidoreductase [Porticoccaceae bacterium]|nr:SDR family NAD(P)-dependent oxidoreductase [Porticoccaceae bacterium]